MASQRGQATVELLAAVPLVLLAGAVALQLLVAGYTLTLADGAAEAGALALTVDRPVGPAIRGSLPEWASGRTAVSVNGGEVTVKLSPPLLLPGLAGRLDVVGSAFSRSPDR